MQLERCNIAPPPTTAVPATIKTPITSNHHFHCILHSIVIPIVKASVMHKPGVMDNDEKTGMKK